MRKVVFRMGAKVLGQASFQSEEEEEKLVIDFREEGEK